MGNINTDIQKQIEERIRKEKKRKETRALKEKLFEMALNEIKQK